jgi:hypothetical protein
MPCPRGKAAIISSVCFYQRAYKGPAGAVDFHLLFFAAGKATRRKNKGSLKQYNLRMVAAEFSFPKGTVWFKRN